MTRWITITGGSSGTGNGSVVFNAAVNAGAARSGTLTIGGQTLTVTQRAAPCTFSIAPASQTIGAAGGSGAVSMTTGSCAWTASRQSGVAVDYGGSSGTGSARSCLPRRECDRRGPDRHDHVAGQSFVLTQTAQ